MSGYLLLINRDGKISSLKTSGMDRASLTWDEQGLFFSDTKGDYLLTDSGMTTWDSPKTDMQVAAYVNPDGTHVGIYNLGFGDADSEIGYIEQVVVTTPTEATRYDIAGYSTVTAQCGSRIFTISEVTNPYISLAADSGAVTSDIPPFWPDMLTQAYPRPDDPSEGFISIDPAGRGGHAIGSACREDRIMAITGGQRQPPEVISWPITGEAPSHHKVVDEDGKSLGLATEVAIYGSVATWSPSPDELVWFGGDGIVRSTNVTTGRSTSLWDSQSARMNSAYTEVSFVGSKVYVMDPVGEWAPDRQMRLRVHDLSDNTTREILTSHMGFEAKDHLLVMRGIAARPNGD
ncbi:MAG: hypothetical protein FWD75_01135 [Propionibacteriaceae bacterium]|nr:hypothetical protein [Propionibacteriaceae bacterium]